MRREKRNWVEPNDDARTYDSDATTACFNRFVRPAGKRNITHDAHTECPRSSVIIPQTFSLGRAGLGWIMKVSVLHDDSLQGFC